MSDLTQLKLKHRPKDPKLRTVLEDIKHDANLALSTLDLTLEEHIADYDDPHGATLWQTDFITKSPYVDVRAYGAVLDGETDDTDAIQDALDACTAGGIVFFPKGTALVSDELTVTNDYITILGSGWKSIIETSENNKDIFDVTGNGVVFRDLMLQGESTTTDTGSVAYVLIRFSSAHYGAVIRCKLYLPNTYGIFLNQCYGVNIIDNHIEGNYDDWDGVGHTYHAGICTFCGVRGDIRGNYITKCVQGMLIGQGSPGLNIDGDNSIESRNLTIIANKFYNNMNHHIYASNSFRLLIKGNICHTTYDGSGMKIHGSYHEISSNFIENCVDGGTYGGHGIALINPKTGVRVLNNWIYNVDGDGVRINNAVSDYIYYLKVCGNVINLAGGSGIGVLDTNITYFQFNEFCNNNIRYVSGHGICIDTDSINANALSVDGNKIRNCDGNGIYGINIVHSTFNSNVVLNSGTTGTNKAGISLANGGNNVLNSNRCYDNQGTKTQSYGIETTGTSDYCVVLGNNCRLNATGGVNLVGSNNEEDHNLG